MMVRQAFLATTVLTAGLLLAACDDDSAAEAQPSASTVVSTVTEAPKGGPETTADEQNSEPVADDEAKTCTPGDLKATLGDTTGEAGQRHTTVVWTNTSDVSCTMTGFAGVDLQGPPDRMGETYSLPRSNKPTPTVSLAPQEAAHTVITWLPAQDGSAWTPTSLVTTPPNGDGATTLQWPGGAVLRQDGATHPGTYVDPTQPGASA